MSQVGRSQVFQSLKVRTSLKNDTCWIQKLEDGNKEEDETRDHQDVENQPIRHSSYVMSTAKRFESHTPTEQLFQTVEAQSGNCVSDMTTENNAEYTDTAVDQSNIKTNEGTVSTHVPLEAHTPNDETVFPVEPTGQPAVNTKAQSNEVNAHTAVDQSNGEHDNAKVILGAYAEGPVAEISAAAGTEESKDGAEVPAVLPVKPRPEEVLSTQMETANATNLMDAGVESTVQPAEGGCDECPPQQTTEEIVEAVADIPVEPSRDMSDVITATPGEEAAPQDSVETVPDMLEKSASELLSQPPAEIATSEGSSDNCPPEHAAVEMVEDVNVKSSPELPGVTNTSGEEATVQDSVETVANMMEKSASESLSQPPAEMATEGSSDNCPLEHAAVEPVTAVAGVNVESSSPETRVVPDAAEREAALQASVEPVLDLFAKSLLEPLNQPPAEIATEGSCDVNSSPEFPVLTDTPGEEATPQEAAESAANLVVDTDSQSPGQPAAETAAESVDSAASAEPVLQARTVETNECEVQPADASLVEQSVEPPPENAADHAVVELSTEDVIEPVRALDAESAPNTFANRAIELTEAFDVEPLPATTGAAAESLKDSEKDAHAEETRGNNYYKQSDVYRNGVCSFCHKIIEGNVRIIFSELLVNSHPDCLRCALCAEVLGDMQIPMFVHNQAIVCGGCFEITL